MKLDNEFEVPMPVAEAWPLLLDVERIVPCMPGARLLGRAGEDAYKGQVSVRLGPVLLAFDGVARFMEVDHAARTARMDARGTDNKGRGGANAVVAFALEPTGGGGTRVRINTDLQLSGSVAQYGRASGLIQGVAKELIGQFAANLRKEIERSRPVVAANAAVTGTSAVVAPAAGVSEIAGSRSSAVSAPVRQESVAASSVMAKEAEGPSTAPAASPAPAPAISGFALAGRVLWSAISGFFRRLLGRR